MAPAVSGPSARMLIFDGDCGFCSSYADWIAARLPAEVEVVPWQRLADLSRFGLKRSDVDCAAWWIDPEGRRAGGEAIAHSLIAAGGHWRRLGRVMLVRPVRPVTRAVYRWVARNRHRLPGATPACEIDEPR